MRHCSTINISLCVFFLTFDICIFCGLLTFLCIVSKPSIIRHYKTFYSICVIFKFISILHILHIVQLHALDILIGGRTTKDEYHVCLRSLTHKIIIIYLFTLCLQLTTKPYIFAKTRSVPTSEYLDINALELTLVFCRS